MTLPTLQNYYACASMSSLMCGILAQGCTIISCREKKMPIRPHPRWQENGGRRHRPKSGQSTPRRWRKRDGQGIRPSVLLQVEGRKAEVLAQASSNVGRPSPGQPLDGGTPLRQDGTRAGLRRRPLAVRAPVSPTAPLQRFGQCVYSMVNRFWPAILRLPWTPGRVPSWL